jgi:hypothetical protein
MRQRDKGPGLFDWADAQPVKPAADVVNFLAVRPTLPRWILARRSDLEAALSDFDKRVGLMPPTPILPFKRKA